MAELEAIANEQPGNYIAHRAQAAGFSRSYRGMAAAAFAAIAAVVAPGCGGGGGGGTTPVPPAASLSVTPNPCKRGDTRTYDASASSQGTSPITRYRFDTDGDGSWDYEETSSSAPDGAFDGKTTAAIPNASDLVARVSVETADGSDEDTEDIDTGFGDDPNSSADALAYSTGVLNGLGYSTAQDQQVQLLDPSTGKMVSFTALEGDNSGKKMYAVYNTDLSQEQKDCLDAREAAGLSEPPVARLYGTDSPDVIDSKLGAAASAAKSAATAEKSYPAASKSAATAEETSDETSDSGGYEEDYYDEDCWGEDYSPEEEAYPAEQVKEEQMEVF